jgi:hypothetical protein
MVIGYGSCLDGNSRWVKIKPKWKNKKKIKIKWKNNEK